MSAKHLKTLKAYSAHMMALAILFGLMSPGLARFINPTDLDAVDNLPPSARGIKVDDKVGDFIPLELSFKNDSGKPIRLSDLFKQDKAIVLSLNYSNCPGLCIAQLENLVETLKSLDCQGLGQSYDIVTVSIDPREDSDKAARTKAKYLKMLKNDRAQSGWHFLVGNQTEITALAQALGYFYTYDAVKDQYNHPAVLYFLSKEGRICRYLTDLGVEPAQLKMAVSEATEGKLDSSLANKFIQFCYQYDPEANRYSADARRIMAVVGSVFVILMVGCLAPFWFSKKALPTAANAHSTVNTQDK
jgi:protein SCO1